MSEDNYRLKSPTLALVLEDGRQVACRVPRGAIVTIDPKVFTANKLIDVVWDGKPIRMFAQDVRARGEILIA